MSKRLCVDCKNYVPRNIYDRIQLPKCGAVWDEKRYVYGEPTVYCPEARKDIPGMCGPKGTLWELAEKKAPSAVLDFLSSTPALGFYVFVILFVTITFIGPIITDKGQL